MCANRAIGTTSFIKSGSTADGWIDRVGKRKEDASDVFTKVNRGGFREIRNRCRSRCENEN